MEAQKQGTLVTTDSFSKGNYSKMSFNGTHDNLPTFVLRNVLPEDVARSLIESNRQNDPFFIFDLDEAYQRIQHFKDMMPRVQIFFAMKSNDSDMLLKLSVALGLGFDCASPGEINKIRRLNVNPLSIIYAMPAKTKDQMIFARSSGVRHTTFDTSYELKKLKQYWPDARLLIRLRVDGESVYSLGEKFGCDFTTEAIDLLEEAASLGLRVVGVAFHVGSACSSVDSHVEGLRQAKALFEHEAKAGRGMSIVDIGGGFLSDKTNRIDQVAKVINQALEDFFPDPSVQVIAEPGRYICDSTLKLYCSICNVRRITKNDKPVNMLYLNDGTYGTLRFPEPWHTLERFQMSSDIDIGELEDTILWGPSCDSYDRVKKEYEVRLPKCTPFDWLVFGLQGAYTVGFSTRFSCIDIPRIRPVISSKLWNMVKDCPVFDSCDFVTDPDISTPLPSMLPAVVKATEYNYDIPTLGL